MERLFQNRNGCAGREQKQGRVDSFGSCFRNERGSTKKPSVLTVYLTTPYVHLTPVKHPQLCPLSQEDTEAQREQVCTFISVDLT